MAIFANIPVAAQSLLVVAAGKADWTNKVNESAFAPIRVILQIAGVLFFFYLLFKFAKDLIDAKWGAAVGRLIAAGLIIYFSFNPDALMSIASIIGQAVTNILGLVEKDTGAATGLLIPGLVLTGRGRGHDDGSDSNIDGGSGHGLFGDK